MQSLAGLPLSRWSFALRFWLAIHLALGVAFWVQLDGADSAGVTAAILATQTRGQTLEKAVFRFLGTAVGGASAIAIAGLFSQARDLYVLAYSAWLGLCVFAAGFLDGSRAYGAVICGYTVSVTAIANIDHPDAVFDAVANRCAAAAIGIVSVTFVIDMLGGAMVGTRLIERLERGRARVRAFTDRLLRDGPSADTDAEAAGLLCAAADQHPLLNALPVETLSGSSRAGAVRAALAALVGEICAARALAVAEHGPAASGAPRLRDLVARRLRGEFDARRAAADAALAAARDGRRVPRPPRMPIYRSREYAAWNGVRTAAASVLSAYLFVLAGWPEASFAWSLIGIRLSLATNAPDPNTPIQGAIIAMPCAVVLGGVTKFLILDGIDQFPLLMLGTAPALILGLLLISSPRPFLTGIGLLVTVYTLIIVSPSNPQSYDPTTFIDDGILMVTAAGLIFVLVRLLFPTSDAQRRRWVLIEIRRTLDASLHGRGLRRSEDENQLLDASRTGVLSGLRGVGRRDLAVAFRAADLARASRRIMVDAERSTTSIADPDGLTPVDTRSVRKALGEADSARLRELAYAYIEARTHDRLTLAADLAWAADLIDGR